MIIANGDFSPRHFWFIRILVFLRYLNIVGVEYIEEFQDVNAGTLFLSHVGGGLRFRTERNLEGG